ncbi:MAG TPA: hypothetical protein VEC76_13270 [Streptosporangiaceae bacterium]|nr:hypothetical protein [Streptosporangiaceae bacterium]
MASSRLVRGEPQVGGAQLGQLPAGPQPRQGQRRIGAAGHHHTQPGRPVLHQEPHLLVHLLGADHVVVVEDQQRLIVTGLSGQFIDQRRHERSERRRRRRPE